ncbi:hypothetical protein ACJX0J_031290 [Zea mays]
MSTNKSIKLYDGYLHDLLFEPERDDIANDIINCLHEMTWFASFSELLSMNISSNYMSLMFTFTDICCIACLVGGWSPKSTIFPKVMLFIYYLNKSGCILWKHEVVFFLA